MTHALGKAPQVLRLLKDTTVTDEAATLRRISKKDKNNNTNKQINKKGLKKEINNKN